MVSIIILLNLDVSPSRYYDPCTRQSLPMHTWKRKAYTSFHKRPSPFALGPTGVHSVTSAVVTGFKSLSIGASVNNICNNIVGGFLHADDIIAH